MDHLEQLCQTSLFCGITPQALAPLVESLCPTCRNCAKGEILLQCGHPCTSVGVLLSGHLEAFRPLPDGTQIPMAKMGPGGVFGDVLGGTNQNSPVTVQMASPGLVLFFSYDRLLTSSPSCSQAHTQMLHNLVGGIGSKYFSLMTRIEILTQKSLRAKICAYLLHYATQADATLIWVPHNRSEMADYLGCDRSALCRELSRMQSEHMIQTYKNTFRLIDRNAIEQLGRP